MKAIDRWIERFCYKHPRFGIPNLMRYIVIGTVAAYLLGALDTTGTFYSFLNFSPQLILRGQIWRLVSFVFISHYSSLTEVFWFAIFVYFYYFIGTTLERQWGTARFTLYYLTGVLLSVLYGFVMTLLGLDVTWQLDGYYINMAMFFAFAAMWPEYQVLVFFIIPVKMKYLAIFDAVLFLFEIVAYRTLYPLVPILNFLLFCGAPLLEMLRGGRAQQKRAVEFRAMAEAAKRAQRQQGYRHKCAVCGRTDAEFPELEFRYCSRCQGYHCFCEEHINNHVHFTE
ncbi:MAG: hypothetical protein ACSW8F_00035 [bacterium]